MYINYSSSAFTACFIGFIKGLESRLVQLRTQVGVVCWTSGSTRTPRLRIHSTVVCDRLYKLIRARASRSYITWSLYRKLINSKHKLFALNFGVWFIVNIRTWYAYIDYLWWLCVSRPPPDCTIWGGRPTHNHRKYSQSAYPIVTWTINHTPQFNG